ncbi:MAG: 2-oxo acid dehydrogenase subunit E2 [Clostridia bacterium]|nr:2-oxo acid dehydrogenase subunit E2 [Clostridia bacterium]
MKKNEKNVSRFGIQRKIVANMTSESWRSIPHVSYIFEPDVTRFIEKYNKFDARLKTEGRHVTINTVLIKAICEALKAAPQMNAHIRFEPKLVRGKTTVFSNIDISMPWILPDNRMMTITMKDMGSRSLSEMTAYMNEVAEKIKNTNLDEVMYSVSMRDTREQLFEGKIVKVAFRLFGSKTQKRHRVTHLQGEAKRAYDAIPDSRKLTISDLKQGTITISNVGALTRGHEGTLALLMIIPPQVCAIGIGALTKKPVIITNGNGEDEIAIRSTVPLDIVFDHRVLDFGEIRPFLDALQQIFDNPEDLLVY